MSSFRGFRSLALVTALAGVCQSTALPGQQARGENPLAKHGQTFDYVIIGGGPGGLVTAHRLSEDPHVTVAVIEAGTWAEDVIGNLSQVPAYDYVYDLKDPNASYTGIDWGFVTTPQAGIYGQKTFYPRGKCLGGSSNLNAMAWSESSRGAFKKWAEEVGDPSWEYDTVVNYYKKAMRFTEPNNAARPANATPIYDLSNVGKSGPVDISYPSYAYTWTTWVATALEGIGIKKASSNAPGKLEGGSWHMSTINHTTGYRSSADSAYLRPILHRPNLAVFNGTLAERIIFDKNKHATGAQVTCGGTTKTLHAKKEVILSAGVMRSPQLLQVSGVGPADVLQKHNIPVVANRPGVGQNMCDHIFMGIAYKLSIETTQLGKGAHVAEDVALFRTNATGRLTDPGGEYVGYEKVPQNLRSKFTPSVQKTLAEFPEDWPEIEYLALPAFAGDFETPGPPDDGSNFGTLLATMIAPTSRGNVSISSARMSDPPVINPNWLTTDSDMAIAVAMFKRLRDAWNVPSLVKNVRLGEEYYPGKQIQTDKQIEDLVRRTMTPVSHAAATNKMGKASDKLAVVDSHGKVYGVKNLRVVDGSAFPFLPPGSAPQAATYMLAEKISDDIKHGR